MRFYSFIAQVIRLEDTGLEKLYSYSSWLARLLPSREVPPEIEITEDMLRLQAFKVVQKEQGNSSLSPGDHAALRAITEFGAKPYTEDEEKSLSEIVKAFNDRHGTEFSEADMGLLGIVILGVEIGSLILTGEFVAGQRLIGGTLWLLGTEGTIVALASEGLAALGSEERELSQEEYDFANAEVFRGTLPPRERIVLTDTIGGSDREFVFPRFDGMITVNLGPAGYINPLSSPGTLIHELVHTWQLQNTLNEAAFIAQAAACALMSDAYHLPNPLPPFRELNMEQQGALVQTWLSETRPSGHIAFSGQPDADSTITLDGVTWTFVASVPSGNQTQIGATIDVTLTALATNLTASGDAQISRCTYTADISADRLVIRLESATATGNSFSLAASDASNGTISAATLGREHTPHRYYRYIEENIRTGFG